MRIELGIPMSLNEISHATGGILQNSKIQLITAISTDSRDIETGDLFIALNGNNFNGTDFVCEAQKKGAFILSYNCKHSDILHPDGGNALLSLANYYTKKLPYILYKIGITGSVGKTTTKEFLKILLKDKYITHASEGNFNNHIGLPMSVLSAKKETQILIAEMGMNHKGEISRLSKCLNPDLGIITNIGTAHIGNLGNRKNIVDAKLEIEDGMNDGNIIIPDDEPLLYNVKNSVTFSLTNPEADCYLRSDKIGLITIFNRGKLYAKGHFAPPGEHHKKCLAAATCLAIKIGLSGEEFSANLPLISNENTRQNLFYREKYCFYADFYNSSRESVLALIEIAKNYKHGKSKSLLLGDILELGDLKDRIHFEIGNNISSDVFNNLFLFGDSVYEVRRGAIESGFPADRIFVTSDISDPNACAEMIRSHCAPEEIIFMKASRAIRLERILDAFKE